MLTPFWIPLRIFAATLVPGITPVTTNTGQPVQLPAQGPDARGDYPTPPDAVWPANGKRGELLHFALTDSKMYPGTENPITVYVPSGYTAAEPACLYVRLDRIADEPPIFENLIARHEMPMTIVVGVMPGVIWKDKAAKLAVRYNRSYEFDSPNANFAHFLESEVLPAVQKLTTKDGRPIRLSSNAKDRAIGGASTGGIGAFTVAWERPDLFSRVFSAIGTFVAMRGGDGYPALIRKTEPKAIRVFLEDGSHDAWNPLLGSWYLANLNMDAALNFAGYDEAHLWGEHGHDGRLAAAVEPDVMRWLWRGWPEPVRAGTSHNDELKAILLPNSGWETAVAGRSGINALAADRAGRVVFAGRPRSGVEAASPPLSGEQTFTIEAIDGTAQTRTLRNLPRISGAAFGPDGALYLAEPGERKIVAIDSAGAIKTWAEDIAADKLIVASNGDIFATEPGEHSDQPSKLWLVRGSGQRLLLDSGLASASGLALAPDHSILPVAERSTKWVYSFGLRPDSSVFAKERYFWLHITDLENDSGAADLCYDTVGDLFVATRLGIQVCDRNGRVRAILPLPSPCGPVLSLGFGGSGFHTLYATDGHKIFRRRLAVTGHPAWSPPITLPAGRRELR